MINAQGNFINKFSKNVSFYEFMNAMADLEPLLMVGEFYRDFCTSDDITLEDFLKWLINELDSIEYSEKC